MSLSQVLFEGRKDEFLSKYREKFTEDNIKKIFMVSRELASNQKFLNFLGRHSLIIYFIHQPIMLTVFHLISIL